MPGSESRLPVIGRLLLIDDNEVDQILYKRLIDRSGLVGELIVMSSAQEALGFLSSEKGRQVDVLIVDLKMPKVNGFELIDFAANDMSLPIEEILIVMLTSSQDQDDILYAQNQPLIDGYLGKPLRHDDLENLTRLLVQKRKGVRSFLS